MATLQKSTILSQTLGVSQRDIRGSQGLVYALAALVESQPSPDPVCRPIEIQMLEKQLAAVRARVEELLWRARLQSPRGECDIEALAESLASHVLPEGGLVSILDPGIHPHFDTIYDVASEIPWEILEERYARCLCASPTIRVRRGPKPYRTMHCESCGKPMEEAGGKLAIDRHLTHLVRGGRAPAAQGNIFLIIEDPTQDLCNPDNKAGVACQSQVDQVEQILDRCGYRLEVIKGRNATTSRVLKSLGNPAVVGVYYFGHGYFVPQADQGCLVLADGPVYAKEIEDLAPGARCVFLNACEAGAAGQAWTLEKKFRSIAHAFARGGPAKTVIAPLWPVHSLQAAQAAVQFFRAAAAGQCLGSALREVRRASLNRYEQDLPDISWMSYRYFGDPNRTLPAARESSAVSAPSAFRSRLFSEGRLDMEVFGFDARAVLLRAAKRRSLQERIRVTATDFLGGLIRTGHLTRFAFGQLLVDPDGVYEQIVKELEETPDGEETSPEPAAETSSVFDDPEGASPDAEKLAVIHKLLSQLIVRKKEEFSEGLLKILERADTSAQSRSAGRCDSQISEQDVLQSFLDQGRWAVAVKTPLPSPDAMTSWLARRSDTQTVDENGHLRLNKLSPAARRIVELSHELSQQRGISPIPNRLMLAAFLKERNGHAFVVFRRLGIRGSLLSKALIAATEGKSPGTFVLSPESAEGVVLPMLERAVAMAASQGLQEISEAILFRAFCEITPERFKKMLRSLPPPVQVDLDLLLRQSGQEQDAQRGEAERKKPDGEHVRMEDVEDVDPDEDDPDELGPNDVAMKTDQTTVMGTGEDGPLPIGQDGATADKPQLPSELSADGFAESAGVVLTMARRWASVQGYDVVRSPHLFAGLLSGRERLLAESLARNGVRLELLLPVLLQMIPSQAPAGETKGQIGVSRSVKKVLLWAVRHARSEGRQADERDLCLAVLADREEAVAQALQRLGCSFLFAEGFQIPPREAAPPCGPREVTFLGVDLTEKARSGEIVRIAARNSLINTALRSLDTGRHPMLVGESGVGKGAIVEGIAEWITEGICPASLRDLRVIGIPALSMMAIARFQEEFERRFNGLLEHVRENAIVWIDEIDRLFLTPFRAAGYCSAQQLLLNALADPLVRVIGTMTPDAYQVVLAENPRPPERFQVQIIEPPTLAETLEIVAGYKDRFGRDYPGLEVEQSAIEAAVRSTASVGSQGGRPGAAIELLRRACNRLSATRGEKVAPAPRVVTEEVIALTSAEIR